MKKNRWKEILICICVLAAGIYYLVSGAGAGMDSRPQFVTDGNVFSGFADEEDPFEHPSGSREAEIDLERQTDGIHETADEAGKTSGAGASEPLLYVHVCGEVTCPGVYALKPGSRVYEAIEMAGGATAKAAPDVLNMAMALEDGMRIEVPDQEKAELLADSQGMSGTAIISGSGKGREDKAASSGKVNINTASREQLMQLKGIGEARAEAIVAYREANGPFGRIEDIMEVSGIKEAAYQKIREEITI